jgi:hypothetical protein
MVQFFKIDGILGSDIPSSKESLQERTHLREDLRKNVHKEFRAQLSKMFT